MPCYSPSPVARDVIAVTLCRPIERVSLGAFLREFESRCVRTCQAVS